MRVVNYASNFFVYSSTRYFLVPVTNFHFRLQFFLQSTDELLEFMETWGFTISFATCQLGNISEHRPIRACLRPWPSGPQVRWPTTSSSPMAACIKVLPVLTGTRTNTRVENYSSVATLTMSATDEKND